MVDSEIKDYVKSQLGSSIVDVEISDKDFNIFIKDALDTVAPYYEGHRFVQASGKVIDLSNHRPLAIEKVYNISDDQTVSLQEYAFGGSGIVLYDTSFMNRIVSYTAFKMLWNEIQFQKGMNYKLIDNTLYLDEYQPSVLIDMLVRPLVSSDIEESSMYCPWVKKWVLADCKEALGRIRGKFTVDGSPYQLDSAALLQESISEKAELKSELMGEIFVV